MKQQTSLAQWEYAWKKKVTRRERFLGESRRKIDGSKSSPKGAAGGH
jgi:hypothetical protein